MTPTDKAKDAAFARHKQQPFKSFATWRNAVTRELMRMGETPVRWKRDKAGNCPLCGEAGHCPGVHAKSEERT